MIDFYTFFTPNGRKVAIMLEETGLDYTVHSVNISKDEQFDPDFLKISPNNKIPAIVDRDNNDYPLFETGAILLYLAEKTGQFLNTTDRDTYWRTMEWLMWQMGGYGPILGQVHHFTKYNPEASEYARTRYEVEARRLYGVLDKRLEGRDYIVDEYSIADMAVWPWAARHNWQEIDLNEYPNVRRWYMSVLDRPAVQRAWNIPENDQPLPIPE
ncbi:MAG: glutathione S-transferase [Rhodospirillaceae bacterium]|jgi:GST-like protein|nr:glutathione S-transferase [Rhodospirillaceae bacterium]MBT3810825.1 glutathione S-transferase [Rhodospirillaceae bacterium]MBT3931395.1 glutathione S-transferase [Rhodospirillaceae bacterium]MBT4772587.1 glutathione S-transferase [Rhodospirillaceae bacterium]MBT5357972.1 glutathione S-transferase [Rhodospirillaceae bacterium]